jgi:Tol biopolymer transport system component
LLRPDLSSTELLPDQPGLQRRASWNPDGSRIAYGFTDISQLRSRVLIWETDADGSEPRLLSEACDPPVCVGENDPGYSPDGTRIAFIRTRSAEEDATPVSVVAVRDLQTGQVTELEATSRSLTEGENSHPRWSPDGQTIAYAVAEFGTDGEAVGSTIRLVGAEGANDRAMTPPELEAGDPEWAPDGTSLLFSSQPIRFYAAENQRDPDRMHLYTMNVDGSDVRQLPLAGPVGAASWTASGEQILFTEMVGMGDISPGIAVLHVMDADGGNVLPVTSPIGTPAWYAVQQPVP